MSESVWSLSSQTRAIWQVPYSVCRAQARHQSLRDSAERLHALLIGPVLAAPGPPWYLLMEGISPHPRRKVMPALGGWQWKCQILLTLAKIWTLCRTQLRIQK